MTAYLKHKEDGRIYIFTDLLAKDPNLEPHVLEPESTEPALVRPVRKVKQRVFEFNEEPESVPEIEV